MTGPAYDTGEASHRALRGIRQELERHPAVAVAQGFPNGEFTSVVAELDAVVIGVDESHRLLSANQSPRGSGDLDNGATLTVRWFAGEHPDSDPEFSFHDSGPDADSAGPTSRTRT